MWLALIFFLLLVVTIFYGALHRYFLYWELKKFPTVKPVLFYGNCKKLSKDYQLVDLMRDLYSTLKPKGPVAGVYIYIRKFVMITDLDLIKEITVKEFDNFSSKGFYSNKRDDPLSDNLHTSKGDQWKGIRRKLSPSFTSGKIKAMFDTLDEISDRLLHTIKHRTAKKMEVKNLMSRFTTDFIGSVCFGLECNTLKDENDEFYQNAFKSFSQVGSIKEMFKTCFPDLSRKLRIKVFEPKVSKFYMEVISGTYKKREDNPSLKRQDLLNSLIELYKTGEFDFSQVASNAVRVFCNIMI